MSQKYMSRRTSAQPTAVSTARRVTNSVPSPRIPNSAFPGALSGGDSSALEQSMRLRMASRFGPDYLNPQAEAEADEIGGRFADAGTLAELKARMGEALGADFSSVRFHTDSNAAAMAEAADANAFATGRDIYMGADGFDAATAAHEMVHTVQQGVVEASAPMMSAPTGAVQYGKKKKKKLTGKKLKEAREELPRWNAKERKAELERELAGDRAGLTKIVGHQDAWDDDAFQEVVNAKTPELWERIKNDKSGTYDKEFYNQMYTPRPNSQTGKYERLEELANSLAPTMADKTDPVVRMAINAMETKPKGLYGEDFTEEADELHEALQDKLDHQVIAESMKLVDNDSRNRLANATFKTEDSGPQGRKLTAEEVDDEVMRAEQSGRDMAHIMLAMQLGKINITEENGQTHDFGTDEKGQKLRYDPTMAGLLSHGGRVIMDFGKTHKEAKTETKSYDVYRSMMELDDAQRNQSAHATKTDRTFATHRLKRTTDANKREKLVETKGKAAALAALGPSSLSGVLHRGFNPAIGGLGKEGIRSSLAPDVGNGNHIIRPNGQNGHMYLGVKDSTKSDKGGMMVGLETSSVGETNLMGKIHNSKAIKSPFSPVGGSKDEVMGREYNGRNVDLTGYSMKEQLQLQHRLTNRLKQLEGGGTEGRKQYNQIMTQLSGAKMSPEALTELLGYGTEEEKEELLQLIQRGQGGG